MTHTPEHGLGRLHAPDERDMQFMLERPREAVGINHRYWITQGPALDQGSTSQCVAYAWGKWLTTNPVINKLPNLGQLYTEAQRNDEWPGEEPTYKGTSVRAGAKVLQSRGLIESYRWAFDVETMIAHVLAVGPMVVGTNWTYSMFEPGKDGFVRPEGRSAGGHAYLLIGASRARQAFRCINSWGRWAQRGRFWISFEHMANLIADRGEACAAFEKRAA